MPIFEKNASYQTMDDLFQRSLHQYTITQDRYVLPSIIVALHVSERTATLHIKFAQSTCGCIEPTANIDENSACRDTIP